MDNTAGLLAQLQQETAEERRLPAAVLEDVENEKAQYEKDLLQGAGGLLLGGAAERTFGAIKKSGKGKAALKRLGMSDEDIETVTNAIKDRDTGALTDFVTRKGADYVDSLGRNIVKKGTEQVQSTAKELFDQVGDAPAKLSKLADLGGDARNILSSAEESATKFNAPNRLFSKLRAEAPDAPDLEQQSQAVKNLLSKSKEGRKLLKRNARKARAGEPAEAEPNNPFRSEFDQPDSLGDFRDELFRKGKAAIKRANPEQFAEPVELDAVSNVKFNPLQSAKDAVAKVNQDYEDAKEDLATRGDRDPYQDVYDEADRVAQRFTDIGKTPVKATQIDFSAPRITQSEHMRELAQQEQQLKDSLPDVGDLVDARGGKPTADVLEEEAPREAPVPPSQQTGGLDPSQLPDDAGYNRGSAKIQAKKQVDEPTPAEPIAEPALEKPAEASQSDIQATADELAKQQRPPPAQAAEPAEPPSSILSSGETAEALRPLELSLPPDPILENPRVRIQDSFPVEEPRGEPQKLEEAKNPEVQQDIQEVKGEREQAQEEQANNPAVQNETKGLGEGERLIEGATEEGGEGEKVAKGLNEAFKASLAEDEVDPAGIVITGLLGIGSLIGGFLRKSHHPHFVQPPALHPYESFSVQGGVA